MKNSTLDFKNSINEQDFLKNVKITSIKDYDLTLISNNNNNSKK